MSDRILSRFGARTPASEVVEGIDLSGRTAIVTGGGSGIGIETARALASAGAQVVLAVRNLEQGEAVAAEIGHGVTVEALDLSDFASIRAFADRWGDRPLHILVNNAGVMACPLSRTRDGLEMQLGTNHFGHFLLTVLLAPALVAAATPARHARVVALSSIGHRRSDILWDDPNYRSRPYDKWEAYGQSKTANALFAVGFDRRFRDRGVNALSVMPGGIRTPLQRHIPHDEMVAMGWIDASGKLSDVFKTPQQGAATSVWAAVAPELEGLGGLYLEDCAQAAPWDKATPYNGVAPHALDPEAAERLWALSVETTGAG